jgi:ATP-binding cassette subfamily B protein
MRHGKEAPEKSKDFFGSIKRIFQELDRYRVLLIVSLLLAAISSILAIVAPNRLSELADTITDGVGVNQSNVETIMNNLSSEQGLYSYRLDGVLITVEDQYKLLSLLQDVDTTDQMAMIRVLDNAPDNIKEVVMYKLDMSRVTRLAIILGSIYLISALFSYITSLITAVVSNYSARDLRNRVSKKINKLPLKYFDNNQVGDLLSRVTNDVDTVSQSLNNSLATLVSSLTLFIGSIVMMFATNWLMALTAILSTFIGFIAMFIILSKSQKYFSMRQKELGKLNSHIEEVYSGLLVVKAYNGKKTSDKEFDELNKNVYKANMMSQFLSGLMQPLMSFVGNFGYVAVCIVGALLVTEGYISFGVIVAFMIYIRLFTNPLSQMAQAFTQLQSTAAAGERVFEFLDEEEMNDESKFKNKLNIKEVKGNIEFKNVKFGYNDDKMIIKNFSAKVKPGNKIAIVGPTGAGKTTLVNLLMKFYNINDGDIIIDGKSIKELKRENIHELFTMVLQDTWLFNGTIKENIKFNRKHVTDEDINRVLDTVGLKHFIATLPHGIDTELSESDSISSGQKQLLTIARGMIEDAPFLILDEATSNVDTRTEELVQKAMDKLMKNHTSFIIAHRLSTIKNADLILVLDDGNIVEMGTHDELIDKNGYYANLYNSQFEL